MDTYKVVIAVYVQIKISFEQIKSSLKLSQSLHSFDNNSYLNLYIIHLRKLKYAKYFSIIIEFKKL